MFFSLIFYGLSVFIHGQQPLELPAVVIDNGAGTLRPRSIDWNVQAQKAQGTLSLQNAEEGFQTLNGVQTRSQGSPTFSIRGSGQSGRVLTLVNEIPLNLASGFGAPSVLLPRESVGALHVLKGPASLFYGSQAMTGAVNFQTTRWQRPLFRITISDTNESPLPNHDFSISQRSILLGTPLYQSGKNFLQASVFYDNDHGDFPFQGQNFSGTRQFNRQVTQRILINGQTIGDKTHWEYFVLRGRLEKESPGAVTMPLLTHEDTNGTLASLSPHFFFSSRSSLKTRASYIETRSRFQDSTMTSQSNLQTWIVQNEWIYDLWPLQFQFFVDGFHHEMNATFLGANPKQDLLEVGPFINFKSLQRLKHQWGGRYVSLGERFLPTLHNEYQWFQKKLWLTYSQGFRNPSLSDLFTQTSYFVGNPHLTPEISAQWELGFRYEHKSSWIHHQWDVRIFNLQYQNFIETRAINPSLFTRENRGRGQSHGLDFLWSLQQSGFRPFLNYNFLETRDNNTGSPFRLSPRHQLSWGSELDWNLWTFEWQNIHWYSTYDGLGDPLTKLPDWQQWNFLLKYRASNNWLLHGGVLNAFNVTKELTLGYPEPQRRYWLQVTYQF